MNLYLILICLLPCALFASTFLSFMRAASNVRELRTACLIIGAISAGIIALSVLITQGYGPILQQTALIVGALIVVACASAALGRLVQCLARRAPRQAPDSWRRMAGNAFQDATLGFPIIATVAASDMHLLHTNLTITGATILIAAIACFFWMIGDYDDVLTAKGYCAYC